MEEDASGSDARIWETSRSLFWFPVTKVIGGADILTRDGQIGGESLNSVRGGRRDGKEKAMDGDVELKICLGDSIRMKESKKIGGISGFALG